MKKFIIFIGVVGGLILNVICEAVLVGNMRVFADEDAGKVEVVDFEKVYIKAINPGYTREIDGVKKSNVGEMIVIARKDIADKTPISLAGLTLSYTNTSGNYQKLVEFPEHSWLIGEILLLRLASSPDAEAANLTYTQQLALSAGPLVLAVGADESKTKAAEVLANATIYDSVCWTNKDGCESGFGSKDFKTMVRDNYESAWQVIDMDDAELAKKLTYDPESYYVDEIKDDDGGDGMGGGDDIGGLSPQCVGLEFSEILAYYAESRDEQFVELHNGNAEQVLLDGCAVKYKNKKYELSGIVKADGYLAVYPNVLGFSLTKNPTTSNVLEILDVTGATVDKLEYFNGQKKGTAYAMIGYDADGAELWKTTYAPTPGEANVYQEFRTCAEGKVINETTGNCVKVTTVEEKICAAGQYLNVLTNRCKKIEEAKVTTCKEGYYLYEETGRCRKIVENTGANYSVTPEEYEEKSSFVALWAVLAVVGVGIIYVIYEFRHEIKKFFKTGIDFKQLDVRRQIRKVYQRARQKLHHGAGRHSRKRGGQGPDNE